MKQVEQLQRLLGHASRCKCLCHRGGRVVHVVPCCEQTYRKHFGQKRDDGQASSTPKKRTKQAKSAK